MKGLGAAIAALSLAFGGRSLKMDTSGFQSKLMTAQSSEST